MKLKELLEAIKERIETFSINVVPIPAFTKVVVGNPDEIQTLVDDLQDTPERFCLVSHRGISYETSVEGRQMRITSHQLVDLFISDAKWGKTSVPSSNIYDVLDAVEVGIPGRWNENFDVFLEGNAYTGGTKEGGRLGSRLIYSFSLKIKPRAYQVSILTR